MGSCSDSNLVAELFKKDYYFRKGNFPGIQDEQKRYYSHNFLLRSILIPPSFSMSIVCNNTFKLTHNK